MATQAVLATAFSSPNSQSNLLDYKEVVSPILRGGSQPQMSPLNGDRFAQREAQSARKRVSFDFSAAARPTVAPTPSPESQSPRMPRTSSDEGNPSNNPEDPCISPEALSDEEGESPLGSQDGLRIQSPYRLNSPAQHAPAESRSPVLSGLDHPAANRIAEYPYKVIKDYKVIPPSSRANSLPLTSSPPQPFTASPSSPKRASSPSSPKHDPARVKSMASELEAEKSKRKRIELELAEIRTRSLMRISDLEAQLDVQKDAVLASTQSIRVRDEKHQEALSELMRELSQKEELIQSMQSVISDQRATIASMKEQRAEFLDEETLLRQIETSILDVRKLSSEDARMTSTVSDPQDSFHTERGSQFAISIKRLMEEVEKLNRRRVGQTLNLKKEISDMQAHIAVQEQVVSGLHEDMRQRDLQEEKNKHQSSSAECQTEPPTTSEKAEGGGAEALHSLQNENLELEVELRRVRKELGEYKFRVVTEIADKEMNQDALRDTAIDFKKKLEMKIMEHEALSAKSSAELKNKQEQINTLAAELKQSNANLEEVSGRVQEMEAERLRQVALLEQMQEFVETFTVVG